MTPCNGITDITSDPPISITMRTAEVRVHAVVDGECSICRTVFGFVTGRILERSCRTDHGRR